MKKSLCVAFVFVCLASIAFGETGQVSKSALHDLGLAGSQVVSDADGEQIRGAAFGKSYLYGLVRGKLSKAKKNVGKSVSTSDAFNNGQTTKNLTKAKAKVSYKLSKAYKISKAHGAFKGLNP